jgi:ketosteroid isomerase-like protein
MSKAILALTIALLAVSTAAASEKAAVMTVVQHWVDGFNSGDSKAMNAACADETSIIDDFPPHEWHGAGACERWKTDFDAWVKNNGATDILALVMKPRHVDVTADRAYVVVPASLSFELKGKSVNERGSVFTLALQKATAGWRITGWAWADH